MKKKLYKSTNKVLSGVLGGIAEYLEIADVTIVRILFLVALVFTGFFPFGILYIAAIFIMPERPSHNTVSDQ